MDGIRLPLDVLELIVDLIATDEVSGVDNHFQIVTVPSALKACSLASRLFLPFTRRHIFEYCKFLGIPQSGVDRDDRKKVFNQLLDHSPEIALHVRHLSYGVEKTDVTDPEVQRLLTRLSMLREIDLHPRTGAYILKWDSIPADHRSILHSLLQLPSMTSLKLWLFRSFPASLLASLNQLKIFTFFDVVFTQPERLAATGPHSRKPRLLELDIDRGMSCDERSDLDLLFLGMRNTPPAFDIQDLQSFTFNLYCTPDLERANIVFDVTHGLKFISFDCCIQISDLKLQSLPDLQSLDLTFEPSENSTDSLHGLADLLATGDTQCYQKFKSIMISVDLLTNVLFKECFDSWPLLDATLTNIKRFPALEIVTIKVTISPRLVKRNCSTMEEILGLRSSHFPSLSKDANIRFKFDAVIE